MNSSSKKRIIKDKISCGFTLIELIAIIGLLASVVLTSLEVSRSRAEISKVLTDYKSVANAIELYRQANNGVYPDDLINPGTAISIADLTSAYLSDYLKQAPSVSPAVVNIIGGGINRDVLYILNPPGGGYPRYYCGNTNSYQDYVLYFTPTQQTIDSGLFDTLTFEESQGGDITELNEIDAACILVNQR